MNMSSLIYGHNESAERLKKEVGEHNPGGIEYPGGTNDRGYPSKNLTNESLNDNHHIKHHHEHHTDRYAKSHHREHHAHGDMVGNSSSAPGKGGSHMKPHFGKPQHGREENHWRSNAIKEAHAENHRRGDIVGTLKRHEHDEMRELKKLEKMHCGLKKRQHHAEGNQIFGAGAVPYDNVRNPNMNQQEPGQRRPSMLGGRGMRQPMPGLSRQPMSQPEEQAYRRGGRIRHRHYGE